MLRRTLELSRGDPSNLSTLAWALALSDRQAEARSLLPRLEATLAHDPTELASVYGALGDNGKAFARLEDGLRRRDRFLLMLKCDPTFDPLRSDARFADLVRRIGFPPGGSC